MTTVVNRRVPDPSVLVDWQADGNFTGTADDVSDVVRNGPGVKISRGRDAARPTAPPMVAAADFTLGNVDKRFSAEWAGSPVYQYVLPDRPVEVSLVAGHVGDLDYNEDIDYNDADAYYDGAPTVALFTGYTDEPIQQPSRDQKSVQIRSLGSMTMLRGKTISTGLYINIRTDEAVSVILDHADIAWPAADRVIGVGDTTLRWWWLDEVDAWDALVQLMVTEGTGSAIYEDGLGRLHFENRTYRVTEARSIASQATFYDTSGSTDRLGFTDFAYVAAMRDVYNDVRLTLNQRATPGIVQVWQYGQQFTLAAAEVKSIIARSPDGNPWYGPVTPVVAVDWGYSGGLPGVTATQLTATTVQLTWTGGAGGTTVFGPVTPDDGFILRAQSLPIVGTELITAAGASSWVTRPKTLDLNQVGIWADITPGQATGVVEAAADYYTESRPLISIGIINKDDDLLDQMITREISDRVTIIEPQTGFSSDIWIEQLIYDCTIGGRECRMGIIGAEALPVGAVPALWDADDGGVDQGWNTGLWST